jgi:EAL domain-containing protein (putative c-di-GMP-specific phosphodiesterase class I)
VWQRGGLFNAPVHIAVNISVRQLQYSNLVQDVAAALADFQLDPHSLVLEITESALMQRTDLMLRTLQELKASGVRLAIDDFGMGYSSLSYLHRFPVDILKIDKSFIDRLGDESAAPGLTSAIVALGATLRMETVAEGVELASQAVELTRLKCRFAQGYFFSRPVTAEEVEEKWLGKTVTGSAVTGKAVTRDG